ncbi:MAG: DUF371 domain-containing protein [Candidatus Thorarchaeota archaeon]
MYRVSFTAQGHRNILSTHATTLEITKETSLTRRGDCIVGVAATLALQDLPEHVKRLATESDTEIQLKLIVNGMEEVIVGHGGSHLTYSSSLCMVARKSAFQCPRTLMIGADKAARDLDREFVERLRNPEAVIECELCFIR